MSETRKLPIDDGALPDADVVAVTSANALRHAPYALVQRYAEKPCFAVGVESGALARRLGFAVVETGPGDARALATMLEERLEVGQSVIYPCGRVRLDDFESALAGGGIKVHAVETYDTQEIAYSGEAVSALLGDGPLNAVLLYSANGARAILRQASVGQLGPSLDKALWLCLSRRVADALSGVEPTFVRIAEEPSEDALIHLLDTEMMKQP